MAKKFKRVKDHSKVACKAYKAEKPVVNCHMLWTPPPISRTRELVPPDYCSEKRLEVHSEE